MRVVLDTNVVMSAIFFGGDPKEIVRAAVSKRIELVATRAVVADYHEIAERLHEYYPSVSYRRPLAILESVLTIVRPATLGGTTCRDPDDDALIACALGGKAKVVCSGDDDLLVLQRPSWHRGDEATRIQDPLFVQSLIHVSLLRGWGSSFA